VCELTLDMLDFDPDHFVCDVSFISLRKVLPCLKSLKNNFSGIVLFKPQFEVESQHLIQGIVQSNEFRLESLTDFTKFCQTINVNLLKQMVSPIKGQKGNVEYLLLLEFL